MSCNAWRYYKHGHELCLVEVYAKFQLETSSFNIQLTQYRTVSIAQICSILNSKSACICLMRGRGILKRLCELFHKDILIWRKNPLHVNSLSHGHFRKESTEYCYSHVARTRLLAPLRADFCKYL